MGRGKEKSTEQRSNCAVGYFHKAAERTVCLSLVMQLDGYNFPLPRHYPTIQWADEYKRDQNESISWSWNERWGWAEPSTCGNGGSNQIKLQVLGPFMPICWRRRDACNRRRSGVEREPSYSMCVEYFPVVICRPLSSKKLHEPAARQESTLLILVNEGLTTILHLLSSLSILQSFKTRSFFTLTNLSLNSSPRLIIFHHQLPHLRFSLP